jgi:NADH-quinone oxidoreductase subunit I
MAIRVGHEMTRTERLYLPAIRKGMALTLRHLLGKKFTMQYPEEKWKVPPGYRGLHKLTKDDRGRVKCVACYMCATACPSECITIEAAPAPWPDREKYPARFDIDMLRCIFCGYCVEACPEEAIVMTEVHNLASGSRQELIYTKERLLANEARVTYTARADLDGKAVSPRTSSAGVHPHRLPARTMDPGRRI